MTLDELVVKLILDAKGFVQGQNEATDSLEKTKTSAVKSGKAIEASALSASDAVEKLGRKFLGLYALFTGGRELKAFVSDMTSADAALGRTARNIDMSAKALSTFQGAAVAAGGSAEGITGSMASMSAAMQEAALTGNNRLAPVMRALGINLADAGGHARNVGAIFDDLNKAAQGMDPARFSSLMHMIGLDDGTINLLEKSRAEYRSLIAEQERYAATAADVDAAQHRQSGFRELLLTSQSLGRSILTALTPAITGAMKAVQDWANVNQAWIRTAIVEKVGAFVDYLKNVDWKGVGDGVQGFVRGVTDIAAAVVGAVKGVDGDSPLFKALEALAVLAGTRLVLAFTGLGAAIGALSKVPLPGWAASLLMNPAVLGTAAVGAVLASGDPDKIPLIGKHPDVQPQDSDLGLPGVGEDRRTDTSDAQAKVEQAGGWWEKLKRLTGFGDRLHDDAKTKENVEDTAKNTKGILDVLKRQADGTDAVAGGITSSGGTPNLRYGRGAGGERRATPGTEGGAPLGQGAKGGSFKGGGANAAMAKEAYDFWRGKGLDHNAALSMVAQEQGESGFNVRSRGDYVNGNPTAHGIFQWHADRRAAILKATGINVDTADHKQQLEAAFYEGTKGMRAGFLQSLNGRSLPDAVHQGVHRFEGSANQPKDTAIRLRMAQGWDGGGSFMEPKTATPAPAASASAPSDHVGDQAALDAQNRIVAGKGTPADHAIIAKHREQENTPTPKATAPVMPSAPHPNFQTKGADGSVYHTADMRDPRYAPKAATAPTFGDLAHHLAKVMRHARKLTHHEDGKPVAVTYVDKNGVAPSGNPLADLHRWRFDYARKHAAALAQMTHLAAGGSYAHTVHNVSSAQNTVNGGVHVHTKATDAKGIAADLEPYLFQGQGARQANRGLA